MEITGRLPKYHWLCEKLPIGTSIVKGYNLIPKLDLLVQVNPNPYTLIFLSHSSKSTYNPILPQPGLVQLDSTRLYAMTRLGRMSQVDNILESPVASDSEESGPMFAEVDNIWESLVASDSE